MNSLLQQQMVQKDTISIEHIGKTKLEINASKLAYNVSTEDLSKGIFFAFLGLPEMRTSFTQLSMVNSILRPQMRIIPPDVQEMDSIMEQLL